MWEYFTFHTLTSDGLQDLLCDCGKDDWELVSVTSSDGGGFRFFFKRPRR
jgi:hypothetical protein